MSLRQQILQDTPSGYWPLDETSGTTAFDRSGNGRNGSFINTPTLNQAEFFRSPRFTAASLQRVEIPDDAVFDFIDGFSIEIWFRLATVPASNFALISKNGSSYYMRWQQGECSFFKSQVGTVSVAINGPTTTGEWHYCAVTKPVGVGPTIHLDGISSNPGGTGTMDANTRPLCLGMEADINGNGQSEHMNGWLAHAAVYPTALSAARIKAHYEAGIRSGVAF